MQVAIHVKGISNKKNTIQTIHYDYSRTDFSVRDFLEETVRLNVREYNMRLRMDEVTKLLLPEVLEAQAVQGKVSGWEVRDERLANEESAISTALQSFEDGVVALFIDGKQMEQLDEEIRLTEKSEVTFVRLTFLAGRLW